MRLAYARTDGASAADLAILAKAEALAAGAMAEEDQEALGYASTLRHRLIGNDFGPSLEEARRAFQKKEAARVAEDRKSRAGREAQLAKRPPLRTKTRVIVKGSGYRGVVLRTTGGGAWIWVEHENTSGGGTWEKAYRPLELDIDTSRKPAARKLSARKPAARKPAAAARKPAAKRKPAARKSSTRKKSRK